MENKISGGSKRNIPLPIFKNEPMGRNNEVSGAGEPPPCGRVAAHLTVRSPHRSPPADFPHGPLQQLIHSTARDCILAKGMYTLGHRNGNDFLIL